MLLSSAAQQDADVIVNMLCAGSTPIGLKQHSRYCELALSCGETISNIEILFPCVLTSIEMICICTAAGRKDFSVLNVFVFRH